MRYAASAEEVLETAWGLYGIASAIRSTVAFRPAHPLFACAAARLAVHLRAVYGWSQIVVLVLEAVAVAAQWLRVRYARAKWKPVTATIDQHQCSIGPGNSIGPRSSNGSVAVLIYVYKIDGVCYLGTHAETFNSRDEADGLFACYPTSTRVTALYSPTHPERSLLELPRAEGNIIRLGLAEPLVASHRDTIES